MSLLVDPEYFLHALKLNYLRRLPDPAGPSSISFSNDISQPNPELEPEQSQPNPYLQLSGLTDPKRWPELLVRGSPPEPAPIQPASNPTPIRTRRRRGDPMPPNPSGSSLRYSETIVGPKGSGSGAGMRVSGRKSIRGSRHGPRRKSVEIEPEQPVASGSGSTTRDLPPAAAALALTEGRASVRAGGGLDPEDSDQDLVKTHSRQTTADTVKGHRHRISAVSFAHSTPPVLASIAAAANTALNRRVRSHTASSIATTISSEGLSEDGATTTQNLNLHSTNPPHSPTPAIAAHHKPVRQPRHLPPDDLANHQTGVYHSQEPNAHDHKHDPEALSSKEPQSDDQKHNLEAPWSKEHQSDYPKDETDVYRPRDHRSEDHHKHDTGAYYSRDHDPDKRLSDLLFNFRPPFLPANRRTQPIVGSVGFEPAPLLVENDDTGDEDTGNESSSNLEEIEEEEEEEEGGGEGEEERLRGTKHGGDSSGMSSNDAFNFIEDASSAGKSLSNTIASSLMDLHPLQGQRKPDGANQPAPDPPPGPQAATSTPSPPPAVRRRERRRVNIKMGQLMGPPTIEEESPNGQPVESTPAPLPPATTAWKLGTGRTYLAASRPSLPDLRRAVKAQNRAGAIHPSEAEKAQLASLDNSTNSPARARSLTTPTPIPTIAIESDLGSSKPTGIDPARNRSDSISATPRRRRNAPLTDTPENPVKSQTTGTVSRRAPLTFKKVDVPPRTQAQPKRSVLTELLTARSTDPSATNPFRCLYALLGSKDRRSSLKLTFYFPFSKEPLKPVRTSIRSDVCVEEVVGFALWTYVEEGREPKLETLTSKVELSESQAWCLRLVEDDGCVDEDFPALERTRAVAKVGSTEFAIVMATEAQAKQNAAAQSQIQRRPSRVLGEPARAPKPDSVNGSQTNLLPLPINVLTGLSGTTLDSQRSGMASGSLLDLTGPLGATPVYLKIRIPSPGKGVDSIMTTLNVSIDMYLADVLDMLCKKKSLGPAGLWALIVPASTSRPEPIIVPLDRTVQSLQGVTSLALMKRSQVSAKLLASAGAGSTNTNPSASIFKRLSEPPQPKYVSINDLVATHHTFVIQTKRRGILGKQERLLTIEDDFVHIAGTGPKRSSYHVSRIVDCGLRGQTGGLRLVVSKEAGVKRYEVEAEDAGSAAEIVRHIKRLRDLYHSQL